MCDHHATDMLRELHWLQVRSCITFKVAMLCYRAHQLSKPAYLKSLLHPYVPALVLHSSYHSVRESQAFRTNKGELSVLVCWNYLPQSVGKLWCKFHRCVQISPQNATLPSKSNKLTGALPVLRTLFCNAFADRNYAVL